MSAVKKPKSMSRDDATELYRDLRKAMGTMQQKNGTPSPVSADTKAAAKMIAASLKASIGREDDLVPKKQGFAASGSIESPAAARESKNRWMCLSVLLCLATGKACLGVLEVSGLAGVQNVQAANPNAEKAVPFSRDQVEILTSLDSRRAELERRRTILEDKEREFSKKDQELVTKIAELRSMTGKLSQSRDVNNKKKEQQLAQLSNVYGSMDPKEAAQLLDQLDVTISLDLIERMPEKRVGQILSLMNKDRALAITKILSSR